ncbi:hypothetical protein [Staphylococcus saprophyticus]|nr:hypothetical protein [Staphylococcus saprophyticus]
MRMLVDLFGIEIGDIFMKGWLEFVLGGGVEFVIGWEFYVGGYKKVGNG